MTVQLKLANIKATIFHQDKTGIHCTLKWNL